MTLVVVPVFMREPPDLAATLRTVRSVRSTDADVDVLLVDDCSPVRGLVDELAGHKAGLQFDLRRNERNQGFSYTVNVGLKMARSCGEDAVLLNADVEVVTPDFSRIMREQPADVVGALLIYPGGELIQHAGVFFSFLDRIFDHRFRFAPRWLPEALVAHRCPVTGAFQYIPNDVLREVGLYDERYRMAWEDVQYCLRVFQAGGKCLYTPDVEAIHAESMFRGRADRQIKDWQLHSLKMLMQDIRGVNLSEFVFLPELA